MSGIKYLWQQTVIDAFESSVESLPGKINTAEKAIAARLQDPRQPDGFERIAIREALRALSTLLREERSRAAGLQTHFHILWEGGTLDWERFILRADADASARGLARPGETYTIKEYGIECPRCAAMKNPDTASSA